MSAKNLTNCFLYIKKFYANVIDALHAMLELILINQKKLQITPSILNSKANINKINRLLNISIKRSDLESFLHEISQAQTKNKLYFYSTPKEINRLMLELLDIKDNETLYNPCFGLGGIFLSLSENISPKIYGEELDFKLSQIAKLILEILNLNSSNLYSSDLLKEPKFIDQKNEFSAVVFDKIICDPPVFGRIGMKFLQNDLRFSNVKIPASYPEFAFLVHSLRHLKTKGVFIVQNLALSKENAQKSFKALLSENKMIEAIIKLPPNLFPYRKNNFCIVVISKNNRQIQYIDASNLATKHGKYNRLENVQALLEVFQKRQNNEFSYLIDAKNFYEEDDFTLQNMLNLNSPTKVSHVKKIGFSIIRGQSIKNEETASKSTIKYMDVAVSEFANHGLSDNFSHEKYSLEKSKVKKLVLKEFDIVISLRGNPKVTIIGKLKQTTIINSSMIALRHKNKQKAIALYCYLFTNSGFNALLNTKKNEKVLDINSLEIPENLESYLSIWEKINKIQAKTKKLNLEINELKCQKF